MDAISFIHLVPTTNTYIANDLDSGPCSLDGASKSLKANASEAIARQKQGSIFTLIRIFRISLIGFDQYQADDRLRVLEDTGMKLIRAKYPQIHCATLNSATESKMSMSGDSEGPGEL